MAEITTALVVISGAAKAAQMAGRPAEAAAERERLDLEAQQQRLKFQQESIANLDLTEKVLQHQIAQATTRGIGLGSASLLASERETLSRGQKGQQNLETEKSIFEANVNIEKKNIQRSLHSRLFGDVFDATALFSQLTGARPENKKSENIVKV